MTSDQEPLGQIGCTDGSVLDVSHHANEVLLAVAGTEIRLSAEAAARLSNLLTADASGLDTSAHETPESQDHTLSEVEAYPEDEAPDPEPEPDGRSVPATDQIAAADDTGPATESQPRGDDRQRYEIDGRPVRVLDLLDAGLLTAGDLLTWRRSRKGERHRARVIETGKILLEDSSGRVFDDPSPAAMTASNTESQPGWNVWCVEGGRSLFDLRNKLIERRSRDSSP